MRPFDPTDDPTCTLATSYLATATGAGGTGPYTYQWAYVSGSTAIVLQGAGNTNAVRWERYYCTGLARSAVWRCTVTDSLGATAFVDVTVTL